MKKILLVFTIFAAILGLSALRNQQYTTPTIKVVRERYISGLDDFARSLEQFRQTVGSTEDPAYWQKSFTRVRHAYKKVEFLLAYLDEDNVRDFLNGAPLPTVNRVVAGVEVYPPRGMQIIEELLYSDDASGLQDEISRLADEMLNQLSPIKSTQTGIPFTDREVLEAIRAGIFRVTSMGLTGFDTPGSGASIEESATALEAMQQSLAVYYPYLRQKKYLADSTDALFADCIDMMRANPDFDAFDRMQTIRDYLEPLYRLVLEVHLDLGLETIYQVTDFSFPLDYLSPSMFSASTFNDHYYSGIGARHEKPEAVALGRLLFFDPILSSNNQRACASCHLPEKAFTDGLPKSLALNHVGNVGRNAPTLLNSVFADKYFYDFRSDRLESQAEHVIFNEKEFNTTYYDILDKINQSREYRQLFREAFGKEANVMDIARALAAYVRSLQSFDSPVDRYLRGEEVALSAEIKEGFNLFMGKAACGTCHFAPTYSGLVPPSFKENESEVIGVPLDPKAKKLEIDPDEGRFANGVPRDRAAHYRYGFKTTTVRNVALTAPYMHNGAYQTLEEVVDFYNKGGGAGMGIDLPHQTLPFDKLNLTEQEQKALVRFMEALTDTSGLTARPSRLPVIDNHPDLNKRRIAGEY